MGDFFDKIKMFFSDVEDFLWPFIKQFLISSGPIVLAAAQKAVLALVASSLTGAEKRDEAFKMILEELKEKGIEVGTALINSAIEAACARLREENS